MNLIVAVDKNWGIGCNNHLLVSLPPDMTFFKKMTMNKVVVMGRKTLESFPNGKPLPRRTNIVLTKNKDYNPDGAIVCHSVEELFETLNKWNSEDIFVIGGASIYQQLLPYCDTAYVTKINQTYIEDTWFPCLDCKYDWEIEDKGIEESYYGIKYRFVKYRRKTYDK